MSNDRSNPLQVGAPDPDLKNSPIVEEGDEDYPLFAQEAEELPRCYFNSEAYERGRYICSGKGELLRCENGVWVCEGSCDSEHP